MALPSSGSISLNQVNVELGRSGTTTISLNDSNVRSLFGVPSGAISMSQGYGKSNRVSISYTFASHTANASLNLSAIGGYSAGNSNITVTINGGVYLYATSTGNYGLNITGGTTGDTLTIVNNGFIMGQGGAGGGYNVLNGYAGGPALNLGFGMSACTINNTNGSAYIGGGGGGGASSNSGGGGGGGAGGGSGGSGWSSAVNVGAGGAGGGIGASGAKGGTVVASTADTGNAGGGGGGRIFPGSGGAGGTAQAQSNAQGGNGGGAGGGGGGGATAKRGASGGAGGSANAGGSAYVGSVSPRGGGGGGGWGASGGASHTSSGGGGGKAVNTNGKSITWTSGDTGRIYGAVS